MKNEPFNLDLTKKMASEERMMNQKSMDQNATLSTEVLLKKI